MKKRLQRRANPLQRTLDELIKIRPEVFEEYIDLKTKAACERYVERIAEDIVSILLLILRDRKIREEPEDDDDIFEMVKKEQILPPLLADKLRELKGMRNIIAHEYGEVDDKKVFDAIEYEIENDVEEFVNQIKIYL